MSTTPALKIETLAIDRLTPDPENVRQHDAKNLDAIKRSLDTFGQRKPIVVAKAQGGGLVVIAGNGTLEAAKALGWTEIAVAHIPNDWDADKARAYAIADNRTAELANWNDVALASALVDLDAVGWDLADLGFEPVEPPIDPETQDIIPDPPVDPLTQVGDVWTLGRHRLVCGDATDPATYDRLLQGTLADLIVTDPPYGVSYTGGHNEKKRDMLANDDTDVFAKSIPLGARHSKPDAALYVWFAGSKGDLAFYSVRDAGYQVRAMIFWHKLKAHYGSFMSQYMPKHEPVLYCHKKGQSPKWRGPNNEVTVWEYDQPARNEFHPTQKPVEVMARAIKNSSDPDDAILDMFGGSGSTLVAAEQTGRSAYLVELEPKFCDVIVRRWEDLTGQKAVRNG